MNEPRFTTGDDWIFKNVLYELSYDIKNVLYELSRLFQRYLIYLLFIIIMILLLLFIIIFEKKNIK